MFNKKIKNEGFTLVEALVSLGILGFLVVAGTSLIIRYFRFNDEISAKLILQNEVRSITEQMINELRKANQASNGAPALDTVNSDSIVFFSNIDSDSYIERIRYFIDGVNLKKGVIKPSCNIPLDYNCAETISILSAHENNGAAALFEYYDDTYSGTGSPLASPVDKMQVKMVGIKLILSDSSLPNPVSLTANIKVNLRNLIVE